MATESRREGSRGAGSVQPDRLGGGNRRSSHLRIVTLLPAFAPRRLFEPDSTARLDTRPLNALCEIVCDDTPIYAGQRVLAEFEFRE